ncbi:MAG: hypothetical protein IKK03_07190 [Lachnospiraceae bacterium]|nr:hypothetical protein [Lachnospiraceae bacterium]
MYNKKNNLNKMATSLVFAMFLLICLCVSSYALFYDSVSVKENIFQTGIIDINLNDGKPVIEEDEFLFEPGMTVRKNFFIENNSNWAVYYRLYLDDIDGGLSDVLEITLSDGAKILYQGTASELTKSNAGAADDLLEINEKRDLVMTIYFPKEAGNVVQDHSLYFNMYADAVQTKNNPNKEFND